MRTDRTHVCLRCALRVSAVDRCPRCQGARLVKMGEASSALPALRRHGPRGRRLGELVKRLPHSQNAVLGTLAAGAFVLGLIVGLNAKLAGGLAAVACLVGAGLFVVARVVLEEVHERHLERGRVTLGLLDPPDEGPRITRTRVRGRVRVGTPVLSPLRRVPCAAFRLVGNADDQPVDDAGGTPFDVVDAEGHAYRVEVSCASVAVEPGQPRAVEVKQPLQEFLGSRLLAVPLRARLEEAVLLDGDEVVVEGPFEEVLVTEGYRDAARQRVFREQPGAPVIIRRAEPAA